MIRNLIILLLLLGLIACCKEEDKCIPVTYEFLQGEWSDYGDFCFPHASRTYDFEIFDDSFKMKKHEITDLLLVNCNYMNSWDEYVKGRFVLNGKGLSLAGFYCDENYNRLLISPCPEVIDTGSFSMEFNEVRYCNDTLIFRNSILDPWQGLITLKRE